MEEEKSQIDEVISNLENIIDVINSNLHTLYGRLQPVLHEVESEEQEEASKAYSVPLAQRLNNFYVDLASINIIIIDIIDRLDFKE